MTKGTSKSIARFALTGAVLFGLTITAHAQTFPSEPIRLVIPYPPGGALSVTGAIIATAAEAHFGQPMISLVRAGGGGATGATFVARSKADGHTLLLGDPTINVIRPAVERLPYAAEDFVPIARITHEPFIFVAARNAPFSTLAEMIAYARAERGRLVYSSDNRNGWTYTAFELLKSATGTEMRGVEFGGGGPALTNVLGGNTMAFAGVPSILTDHIKSGAVKPLCVSAATRFEPLPTVPTCAEAGARIEWGVWIGVFAPTSTPAEAVTKLRTGFAALVQDADFRRLVDRIGAQLSYLDAPAFDETLKADAKALSTALPKQ